MRFVFRFGFAGAAALAFVVATSCNDDPPPSDLALGNDGGAPPVQPDIRPVGRDAESPISTMRLAHFASQLGPIDFCYQAARSGTFIGPVLGAVAAPKPDASAEAGLGDGAAPDSGDASDAASLPGVDAGDAGRDADVDVDAGPTRPAWYRSVSKYLNLAVAGPVTIAIVEAGATSCAGALASATVTLDPGKLSTVVLFGSSVDGGTELSLGSFTDDPTTSAASVRVRVIHAALNTSGSPASNALSVRALGSKTVVLADRVEPRRAAGESIALGIDTLGYVTAAPLPPPVSISVGPATTDGGADAGFDPWRSAAMDLDLRGDSLHTAFILTSATGKHFEVLWCADTTTAGDQTKCELVR